MSQELRALTPDQADGLLRGLLRVVDEQRGDPGFEAALAQRADEDLQAHIACVERLRALEQKRRAP